MFALVTQADGTSRGQPWVTYALALLLAGGFAWLQLGDVAERTARIEAQLEDAIAYYRSHPYLELDPRLVERAGGEEAMGELREEFMSERSARGLSIIPRSIVRRTQKKLDAMVGEAYAEQRQLPHWRLGVLDASTPAANWLGHLIAHGTLPALIVGLFFLLCLGGAIEGGWGPFPFAVFCAVAVPAGAVAYAQLHGDAGVPWHGSGGLVAALLGAYFVRAIRWPALFLGGLPMPAWLLLALWIPTEYLLVRGLAPSAVSSGPVAAHAVCFGVGAAAALVVRYLGVEESLRRRDDQSAELVANPVLDRALAAHETGRTTEAYQMLKAEVEIHPRHADLVLGLWTVARACGAEGEAAPHLLEIVRQELKRGKRAEAAEHWLELSDAAPHTSVEPALLVRLGEALLDEGQPNDALLTMARALDEPDRLPPPLARRIVRITRDLDPHITARAAAVALRDDHLDAEERADLETLSQDIQHQDIQAQGPTGVDGTQPSAVRPSEPLATPEPAAGDAEAASQPEDLSADMPDLSDPSHLDPGALTSESLSEDAASADAAEQAETPAEYWNDPGLIEDLSQELEDEGAPFDESGLDRSGFDSESYGAVSLEDVSAEAGAAAPHEMEDGSTTAPLLDDDLGSSPGPLSEGDAARSAGSLREGAAGRTTAVEGLSGDGEAAGPTHDPGHASAARPVKLLEGVPISLDDEGIKVEVDGRGKTRLPLERLEALAVAVVGGLGERPVLLVDLVLNWTSLPDEPLKVIRLRSDRFDPTTLVSDAGSAVDALKALLGGLLEASGATPLPSAEAVRGEPFASCGDLAQYHADVLMVSGPEPA